MQINKVAKPKLSIIVPALREPEILPALADFPAILRFLMRATHVAGDVQTFEQAVLQCHGFTAVESTRLPAGICGLSGEVTGDAVGDAVGDKALAYTSRADPVFIKAEPDHASIHSAAALQFTQDESGQLIKTLNAHFSEVGVKLIAGDSWRWYLCGPDGTSLQSEPLTAVSDRNVTSFLEPGSQPVAWRQLQTEIQMVLHDHPVNVARIERGLQPINSLWCWGGHEIPERNKNPEPRTYAADEFVRGLGKLGNFEVLPLSDFASGLTAESTVVCSRELEMLLLAQGLSHPDVFSSRNEHSRGNTSSYGGGDEPHAKTLQWLNSLLASAMGKLLRGKLDSIDLIPCDGERVHLRRLDLLRFWRKRR